MPPSLNVTRYPSDIRSSCHAAGAQTFTISGRVVDKDNRPAPGVRVTVQRGQSIVLSTVTGASGAYRLTFQAGDPVTIVYAGGGWLPNKVQNLSGRTNHSLGKVLLRPTETAGLTQEEIDALVAQRQRAQDAHHCPLGRPTSLLFTCQNLDRQFRRT